MTRVWMIRHGKPSATWGDEGADDPGLDDTGREQARAAAQALAALPNPPTAVVSSPLRRCRETAQPYADALGVELIIDPRVGEIPTPKTIAHEDRGAWLREAFGGTWGAIKGDLSYEDWRREVSAAVASHAGAAVFSHYVAINGAVSLARNDDRVMGFRPDHASITTFEAGPGSLVLVELGREAATSVL